MSIEIIPAGASAVVTERRHEEHDSDRYRTHDRFAQVGRDTKDTRFDIVQEISKTASAAALAAGHSNDKMGLASSYTNDKMASAFAALTGVVSEGSEEAQEAFSVAQKQVSDAATSTLVGFKDLTALSYQVEGRGLLEAAKNSNSIMVQAQTFSAALGLQAQTIGSASALLAQQNAAAAAAQLAECCCELRESIKADGEKTRDLVSDIEHDRLRDKAQKAESMLAAYFAAGKAPVVP